MPRLSFGSEVTRLGARRLEAAERAFFHEHGYLAIDRLVDEREVDTLDRMLRALLVRPEPMSDGSVFDYLAPGGNLDSPRVVQLLGPCDYEPAFFDTNFFAEAAGLAHDLLGEPVLYRGSHFIEKPPESDNPTPFHQDEAFWDPALRHEAIAVWLPLGAATEENGALSFVPGSHRDPDVLPHKRVGDDPSVHALEVAPDHYDASKAVTCPLRRGGATVYHCRVVHGTGPNRSPIARRSLILSFAKPPTALETPRSFPWQEAAVSGAALRRAKRGIELQ